MQYRYPKTRRQAWAWPTCATFGLLLCLVSVNWAQTTAFTYQGKLTEAGNPANGTYDLQFKLFDALAGGSQVGTTLVREDVPVANGVFTTSLDFGAAAFPGADRWLEISVRPGVSTGVFTALSPLQPLTATPYAVQSLNAANAANAINATNATTAANFSGALAGDVTGTQGATTVARLRGQTVASTAPTAGQVLKYNGTTNQWEPAADSNSGGTLTGLTAGTGLSGGGTSGNVALNLANGGVGTAQLADNNVTDAKINSVTGSKVTGAVANATNAVNATNAANATNATNATTAVNFSGALGGDVTGNQSATTVEKLRNVSLPAPVVADNGKVLKYKNNGIDPVTFEWATDNTSAGGVTNVTASAPLASSGGATPNVSLTGLVPLANGGTGANLAATGGAGQYLKQTAAGGAVAVGTIPANDLPDLSASYVRNGMTPQASSNFNISGSGVVGGTLTAANVGIGTAPNTPLDLNGALSVRGTSAPALAPAGQGRIFFDAGLNKFRVSQNNGAYADLVGGGGGLTLPFSASQFSDSTLFDVTQTGDGRAALFTKDRAASTSFAYPALEATTNGTGLAASFSSTNDGFANTAVQISATGFAIGLQVYGGGGGGWFLPGYPGGVYASSGTGTAIQGSSTSGIGTYGGASTGTGVYAQIRGTGNALIAVQDSGGASTTSTNNLAIFKTNVNPGVGNVARIDNTGRGFFNGGTQVGGADMAEAFAVEGDRQSYEPGDVLNISQRSDRTVEKSLGAYSTLVAGVYATRPGVTLTERDVEADHSDTLPLGVIGVIPTKVCAENGPIRRGDLLVTSSTSGTAMRGTDRARMLGAVIGKALEDFTGPGGGVIKVLVTMK
jgi:hypothetical protein